MPITTSPHATPSQAEIITGIESLPGLSPAMQAILPRLSDDSLDAVELGQLVGKDAVLAVRVLRLANSPFYGLSRQIGSLRDAVAILGFGRMRGLVLSAGLISVFSATSRLATERSQAAAAAAGTLAKGLGRESNTPYTAALLHNLGALLLNYFSPLSWEVLEGESKLSSTETGMRLAREREVYGYDHCELGAEITRHWHFPAMIQHAIRHYPLPPTDSAESVTDLVHCAWAIAESVQNNAAPAFDAGAAQRLGMGSPAAENSLDRAVQAAREQIESI